MIIGTGIDIIEVQRIEKAIERWGDHFLNYVFHEEEIAYARNFKNSSQHFAARFAAKEAIYKAIGSEPHIGWKDIKILNNQYGQPYCEILNKSYPHQIVISLSHTKNYAVANAIVTKK